MPLGKHWAIFLESFKNHPCQPIHYCVVYAYCVAPLLIIASKQNARVRLRAFAISVKNMQIIAFLCYAQIIYNTNTYLWTAYNVRIPIITVIITYFCCVRKSHDVTLCLCFYHFITIGASWIFLEIINTQFRYQIIVLISMLCSNRVMCIAVHATPTAWWELACLEQAYTSVHGMITHTCDGFL